MPSNNTASGRFFARLLVVFVLLLAAFSLQVFPTKFSHAATSRLVGPKQYYLALGDSLAYGLQPNGDATHGYVDDIFKGLQSLGTQSLENLGCPGATTTSLISGTCAFSHVPYSDSQLNAAVAFLTQHAGQVSPVTIDIGGNDTIASLCTTDPAQFASILNTVDTNLKQTILPRLRQALTVNGVVTGDLVLMNYYDPYHDRCSASISNTQTFDQHLADDASAYATVVDVLTAFGGPNTTNTCSYTWMCSSYQDIHATTLGYSVIAQAFFNTTGYTSLPPTPTPTTPETTPTPSPGGGCQVTYTVNQWSGGFTANLIIRNTGSTTINGWNLTFTFPGNQQITQIWNGVLTQNGNNVTITNASYNATIMPNGTANPGFNGSWSGSNPNPTLFKLNGVTCSVL